MFSRKWKIWRFVQMNRSNVLLDRLRRGRRRLKSKRISLPERSNLLCILDAVGTDHQQIGFKYSDTFGDKLHESRGRIRRDHGVHRILEDMAQFTCDFAKQRVAVGAGAAL